MFRQIAGPSIPQRLPFAGIRMFPLQNLSNISSSVDMNSPYAAGGTVGTSSIPSSCSKGRNTENAVPLLLGWVELRK